MGSLRGYEGELRCAWHKAAALGPWTLTAHTSGCDLEAKVVDHDAYWAEQPSLTFRVSRQNGVVWEWPVIELQLAGETLTATLGPQKE